ncbi:MAG: hypothetical protein AAF297_01705 [Planctomycetota bacterium]
MPQNPPESQGPLPPDQYLQTLRAAINPKRNRQTINALREACDAWTISDPGADPCEPLVNVGRPTIEFPNDEWNSISFELLVALSTTVLRRDKLYMRPERMTHHVAAYIGAVHLEYCATDQEPPMGTNTDAVLLPLLVAARTDADAREFRRYLLGWYDRAGTREWNLDEWSPSLGTNLSHTVALAIALGSAEDPSIGPRIAEIRGWLEQGRTAGTGRFQDVVDRQHRDHWQEVIAASATDARVWADAFAR